MKNGFTPAETEIHPEIPCDSMQIYILYSCTEAHITPQPFCSSTICLPLHLQHMLQVLRDLEGSGRLTADLLHSDVLGVLGQGQTFGGADVEHGQVGDDLRDAAGAG